MTRARFADDARPRVRESVGETTSALHTTASTAAGVPQKARLSRVQDRLPQSAQTTRVRLRPNDREPY